MQELFTHEGIGSMVSEDPLETLRDATIDDVGGILALIQPLETNGILVRRSRELMEMEIDRFSVLEYDGLIIGCAALYPFPKEKAAELACMAVHSDYRSAGRGETLLEYMQVRALGKGFKQLFVLTTRTAHWFLERGFIEAGVDKLPKAKQGLYNYQRRSKVFMKKL